MMKILVISHLFPNQVNPTLGLFVQQQIKALAKHCDLRVIAPLPWVPAILRFNKKWQTYNQTPDFEIIDGIKIYRPRYLHLPGSFLLEFYHLFYATLITRLIAKIWQEFNFDIIHTHATLPDGQFALSLRKKYHVPVVVSIHGQTIATIVHRNALAQKLVKSVFNQTDALIANSRRTAVKTKNYVKDTSKLYVINNGIDLGQIQVTQPLSLSYLADRKVLVSVSNLLELKGIEFTLRALVEVIQQHPRLFYLIIGDGPDKNRLQQIVQSLNLTNHVKFLGLQPHAEALRYVAAADMFVLPSWNEAFGIAYLEAMAFGKPVVACQKQGIADVITNGQTGLLVRPKDVSTLKKAILKLVADERYGKMLSHNARQLVTETYTWENNALKLITLYQKLVAGKGCLK